MDRPARSQISHEGAAEVSGAEGEGNFNRSVRGIRRLRPQNNPVEDLQHKVMVFSQQHIGEPGTATAAIIEASDGYPKVSWLPYPKQSSQDTL